MDLFNLLFRLDFNTPEEKKLVDEVFTNAMMVLSEEDRGLPQVGVMVVMMEMIVIEVIVIEVIEG